MTWSPTLAAGTDPLPVRLARGVAADIRAGRLRAGARLPGARKVAEALGLHRNTVLAAWRELDLEGWVEARPRSGLFVKEGLAAAPSPRTAPLGTALAGVPRAGGSAGEAPTRLRLPPLPDLPLPAVDPPRTLVLHGGRPDLRLLPLDALGRAWRRTVAGHGRHLVDYGDPAGLPALRRALAAWLAERRGLRVEADGLVVTRGSQQALHLAARALFAPGARLGVEALGYPQAWGGFRLAGVELVPVPVDAEGVRVDLLPALRLDGLYVTPHHQYPTMVGLSPERRVRLLAWAAERGAPVLEDDYDHEFHFAGAPRLPLAAADRHGVVVYTGTLSKALAPGLRIGFVVAAPPVLDALVRLRTAVDRQGDAVTERAVAALLEEGELERHARRMRRVYAARGVHLAGLVRAHLGVDVANPEGGLACWVPSPVDPAALRRECELRGVSFRIGQDFTFDGAAAPFLRLGYANLDLAELSEAMERMGEGLRALGGPPGPPRAAPPPARHATS